MDPTTNLKNQRDLARDIVRTWDDSDGTLTDSQAAHVADLALELAENMRALDSWLKSGGFLPSQWKR